MRYSPEKKQEVVDFVVKYNQENGRGGQSAAAKEYELSPITVAQWLKKAGVKGKKGASKKAAPAARKATRKGGRRKAAPAAAASSDTSSVLQRLMEIQEQIEELQSEYESLKAML